MAEEDEITCENLDEIIESLSELQDQVEDEKDSTAVAASKSKKIDPKSFFSNLKEGSMMKKDSTKTTINKDKSKNVDDFKKKLFLKNIDTN
jgi:hypothetical protein